MADRGIHDIQDINMGGSKEEIAAGMYKRARAMDFAFEMFGEHSHSFFMDHEVDAVNTTLSDMTHFKDKLDFITSLSMAIPEDGYEINETRLLALDQLRASGVDVGAVMSGELVINGKKASAIANLKGAEVRRLNPKVIGEIATYRDTFRKVSKGIYVENTLRGDAVFETALNIYAQRQNQSGEAIGIYKPSTFEASINEAMSGYAPLNYGKSSVLSPDVSMTEKQLRYQLDYKLSDQALKDTQLSGIAQSELRRGVKDGSIRMVNSSSNEVLFYRPDTYDAVRNKDGSMFTIEIERDYKITEPIVSDPPANYDAYNMSGQYPGMGTAPPTTPRKKLSPAEKDQRVLDRRKKIKKIRMTADNVMEYVDKAIKDVPEHIKEIHKEVRRRQSKQRESETYVDEQGRIQTRYVD